MKPAEFERMITAWIALHKVSRDSPEGEALFWAEMELSRLAREDPDTCWRAVREILKRDRSQIVIGSLSSGVVEDLLSEHGEEVIDLIEDEAERNPTFAFLLGGVWQGGMPEHIWERVQRVATEKW